MSIPRRLCADTIRDFARYVGECGDDVARVRLLEAAEAYIAGRDMPEAGQDQREKGQPLT